MQLYQEGILQGITVEAIPGSERPKNLDGTMVGDIGFDPLGFSNWLNLNWAREAEIKHGRVAMLAATGMIVQDIAVIPGFDKEFSGAAMMKLHNLAPAGRDAAAAAVDWAARDSLGHSRYHPDAQGL